MPFIEASALRLPSIGERCFLVEEQVQEARGRDKVLTNSGSNDSCGSYGG